MTAQRPTTVAGNALLGETSQSALGKVRGWNFTIEGMAARIIAIEAEAAARALEELRVAVEGLPMTRYATAISHSAVLDLIRAAKGETA